MVPQAPLTPNDTTPEGGAVLADVVRPHCRLRLAPTKIVESRLKLSAGDAAVSYNAVTRFASGVREAGAAQTTAWQGDYAHAGGYAPRIDALTCQHLL